MAEISYLGTRYAGWQIQDNADTIQANLDKALSIVLHQTIYTTGSSRTDAGVHAKQNTAHFDFDGDIPLSLLRSVNALLPEDISINKLFQVKDDFNARFEATFRSYNYILSFTKNPFHRHISWYYPYPIPNNQLLNTTASMLLHYLDYASFCKAHGNNFTTHCVIEKAEWIFDYEKQVMEFQVKANRFLRGMVRALVATQLQVGRGKMSLVEFENLLRNPIPQAADFSAPAIGLTLNAVGYDFNQLVKLDLY